MSTLINNITNILADKDMAYTDILIQADEPMRVFSPMGWADIGFKASIDEMQKFACHITGKQNPAMLALALMADGASNIGCVIGGTRVRVDVSLVTGAPTFDAASELFDLGIDVHEPTLEIIIRRHRDIIPLENLRLPGQLGELLQMKSGLILVTGPTASGKTSTCASALDYLNKTTQSHIVTIQDPIEYRHRNVRSVFSDKEVGRDTPSFACATKDALRQRPDVIFISELRDAESCQQALYASQSALVIATTHAPTLEEGIERIINFFPSEEMSLYRSLRSAIRCVIAQSLLPTDDGKQFQLFYEYVSGTNAVMQQCLGEGKGFRPLREALADHALMFVDGQQSSVDENTRRRMTGLMSINPRLIEAVLHKKITLQDAKRATPDPLNLVAVHNKCLDKRKEAQARTGVPA